MKKILKNEKKIISKLNKSFVAAALAFAISVTGMDPAAFAASPSTDTTAQSPEILRYPVLPIDPSTQVPYEDGSYYSNTGKACTCHSSQVNNCDFQIPCDCKVYANSIQCMAFAKYCHTIYNKTEASSMSDIEYYADGIEVNLTNSNLYSQLTKAGKKSYLRGSGHSIFIVTFTTSTVEFYDANYGDQCIVHHANVPYSEFLSRFRKIDFAFNSSGTIIEF